MNDTPAKAPMPVTGRRRMARYCAVQAFYQWRLTGHDLSGIENELPADSHLKRADGAYLHTLIDYMAAHHADLDKQLVALLDRPMERLDPVEISILYVGLCELNCCLDTPPAVVIDEAVSLAQLFGCQDSYKYINAVLHKAVGKRS